MSENNWKEREVGALWRIDSEGQSYYNGDILDKDGNKRKIVCFKNKYKTEGSNQPDIRIYLSDKE